MGGWGLCAAVPPPPQSPQDDPRPCFVMSWSQAADKKNRGRFCVVCMCLVCLAGTLPCVRRF